MTLELDCCEYSTHLEPGRTSGFATEEKIPCGLIICEDSDSSAVPLLTPESESDENRQELEVGDAPFLHVWRNTGGEVGVGDKIVSADPRFAGPPAVGAGIDSDVAVVDELDIGATIPLVDALGPPSEVQSKVVGQSDRARCSVGDPLCLQHPRQVKSTRRDDVCGM